MTTGSVAIEKSLPPPLGQGSGWPWSLEVPVSGHPLNNASLPKISIITPSYNQAAFIEQTIRSVLLQGYPNLEYIVIDGGSQDGTADILKYYDRWLTYWVSEPDQGQSEAINKGLRKASGDLIAYLNSDDYYLPGALRAVGEAFSENPEANLLYGRCHFVQQDQLQTGEHFGSIEQYQDILDLWGVWWQKRQIVQPEAFWSARIMKKVGFINENLHYAMDYDYWVRILREDPRVFRVDFPVAAFRLHSAQKSTAAEKAAAELLQVVRPYLWERASPIPWRNRFPLQNHWLYQSIFLARVLESTNRGENRLSRYAKLAGTLLAHPQILLDSGFRVRLQKISKFTE